MVPLYHPVRLVAEIGMTQALLGERFLLGIGSGYQPYEFERFGADLAESKERLDEFLALMDRAYAGETFSFDGAFTALPETSISTRAPGGVPPIWVAGDSETTHRLSARRGFVPIITGRSQGAAYLAEQRQRIDAAYEAEGLRAREHGLGVLRFVCVTESDEETRDYLVNARQQARFAAALRNRQEAMDGGMLVEKPASRARRRWTRWRRTCRWAMPPRSQQRLTADIRASGASHMMLNIQAAGSTMVQAERTIAAHSPARSGRRSNVPWRRIPAPRADPQALPAASAGAPMRAASEAARKGSIAPSSTASGLLLSTPVRRSLTMR